MLRGIRTTGLSDPKRIKKKWRRALEEASKLVFRMFRMR